MESIRILVSSGSGMLTKKTFVRCIERRNSPSKTSFAGEAGEAGEVLRQRYMPMLTGGKVAE